MKINFIYHYENQLYLFSLRSADGNLISVKARVMINVVETWKN